MTSIHKKTLAFVLTVTFLFQVVAMVLPQKAQATHYSPQVVATGDAVINEIIKEYAEKGTTYFVFDGLPNVYSVGTYVHANLPYNIFPWSSGYTFSWGTGKQLVIDFQDNDADYEQAMAVIRQQAADIKALGGTEKDWFDRAFHQVSDNIVYDDTVTTARREQTIYGAVLDLVAVCNGYASYLEALLNELGITAYKVHTTNTTVANDVGHAVGMMANGGTQIQPLTVTISKSAVTPIRTFTTKQKN